MTTAATRRQNYLVIPQIEMGNHIKSFLSTRVTGRLITANVLNP
jgi:hypothetical protein